MSDKQDSNIPWWAVVLGFIFFWPIGMVLLFLSLGGVRIPFEKIFQDLKESFQSASDKNDSRHSRWSDASRNKTTPFSAPSPKQEKQPRFSNSSRSSNSNNSSRFADPSKPRKIPKLRSGKLSTILGGLMSFTFLLGLVSQIADSGISDIENWFPTFGFFCAGLALLGHGVSKTRMSRRQRLYLGAIGQRSSVYISDLASAVGVSEKQARADLQRMLADGFLPMGYIDQASGRLLLTDQGVESYPPRQEPEEPVEAETSQEFDRDNLLREIRKINTAILDPVMSRKIDRIEEITGKILAYQKKNPQKSGELRRFLDYYLPTTLKILNAYAQMDAQGIEGQNISAAKKRIENMMDKVVEGFEKQLDQLFQTDAMDITTDVEVLERMLEQDGLGSGMTFP